MDKWASIHMAMSGFECGQYAGPSLLRYRKHEYASKHTDALTPDELLKHDVQYQHLFTCIAYLNDDCNGGELEFNRLGIKLKPQQGDMYIWKNVLWSHMPPYEADNLAEHRSLPVRKGVKYALVKFYI